jgi:protein-L-isoaspartate(D-aspartate) O-methyltransferase
MGTKKKTNSGQGNNFTEKRKAMVDSQIRKRGVRDLRLLAALEEVPRHLFVPARFQKQAYNDEPLPIGLNQTISQPYIVAYMIEQLQLNGSEKVLEIGTGSGYQTALLAELADQVFTIEILPELSGKAEKKLRELRYTNIHFRVGNGYDGWPEAQPFEAVIVSAAPRETPEALMNQLDLGGRMIIPVGDDQQELMFLLNTGQHIETFRKIPVRFVPMTGKKGME